jgi:hypothetical protein
MVWEGMLDEALAICRGVEDRYHPARHNPFNEIECGDHYARAMASWGVYTALAGFEYHGPKGHMGFSPRIAPEDFRAAFTAAEGWGSFAQSRTRESQQEQITLRWGHLNLKTLAFAIPEDWKTVDVTARIGNKSVKSRHTLQNGRVRIELTDPVRLSEKQELQITIDRQ